MKRVVSLFLPTSPTDRFYRSRGDSAPPRDKPLILVRSDGRSKLVHAANVAARRIGISTSMPTTQAQALVPDLIGQLATPDEDADALARLGLWAIRRYAPAVAAYPPDGLVMDCTGVAHLFGSEAAMLEDIASRLRSSSIAVRSAIAPTWGAAFGLARFKKARQTVVAQGELADALAPLPRSALRLDPETVAQLRRLDFETVGELNATPRAPIAHRFRQSLLIRIDQAYGRSGEPFTPLEAPELPRVTRGYPEPISAPETLRRYVTKLSEQMATSLEQQSLGATQIDMLFFRIDN